MASSIVTTKKTTSAQQKVAAPSGVTSLALSDGTPIHSPDENDIRALRNGRVTSLFEIPEYGFYFAPGGGYPSYKGSQNAEYSGAGLRRANAVQISEESASSARSLDALYRALRLVRTQDRD